MCLSAQRLTVSPRWCLVHRRLSVYPGACADTYFLCSSLAFVSLGLICLRFCSSRFYFFLFFFFLLCLLKSPLCPFYPAPGESFWPVQNILSLFDLMALLSPCIHGRFYIWFSALPRAVWLLSWTEGLTLLCRAEYFETWTPDWSDSSTQHQTTFDKNLLLNQNCSLLKVPLFRRDWKL